MHNLSASSRKYALSSYAKPRLTKADDAEADEHEGEDEDYSDAVKCCSVWQSEAADVEDEVATLIVINAMCQVIGNII